MARRRLPRLIFDFIDGGAGDEMALRENVAALAAIRLQPRVLVNVDQRCLKRQFLGQEWDLPFGIAPMGMCNLAGPEADLMLARAAVAHHIPLCLSTMASTSIEAIGRITGRHGWFQLYMGQSEALAMRLVERAEAAGYPVLMLTVDVPQVAPRRRDRRNGFYVPFRLGVRQFIDFALHPRWSLGSLMAGVPRLANFADLPPDQHLDRNASRGLVDWSFLDRLRQRWPGQLVIKGVMSPDDAQRIRDAGVDAVYVSNHGGRQLGSAPAAIQQLPQIRAALGPDYPLLFDSGIRDGEGVLKALALGADFVLLGRPFLYGIGAAGEHGLARVIELMRDEMSVALAQLGKTDLAGVDESVLAVNGDW